MDGTDPRSLPELVSAITGDLATLVRKESELIRAEVGEKVHEATQAGVQISLGGALLIGAYLVLLQALVLALSKVMDPLWAAVVVGLVVGAIGFLMIKRATAKVKPANLTPDRSVRQIQKDAQLVKGHAQ